MTDTVTIRRELLERVTKTCMFTMPADDYTELRAILAAPRQPEGEVKHYWPEEIVGTGELVVYLNDYAALEAELATVKKVAYGNMELLEENAKLRAELERRAVPESWRRMDASFVIEHIRQTSVFDADLIEQMLEYAINAAAPPAPKADDPVKVQLLELVSMAFEFINKSAEHDSVCNVFDLDEDDRHKDCNCGLDAVIRALYDAIAAARQEGGKV